MRQKIRLIREIPDFVPSTIDEAVDHLKSVLHEESIALLKEWDLDKSMAQLHFGLGRWIRNAWGLWSGGPLKTQFEELGLKHADDMSGVILKRLWCEVNDSPFDLEGEIKFYQDYWKEKGVE